MKPLTTKRTDVRQARDPREPAREAPKAASETRKDAQCCAKVSRLTAGCHD